MRKLVGKRIRLLRKVKSLTQEQLAEKADLSSKYICEVETGKVSIGLDSLAAIARGLDVRMIEFFPEEERAERLLDELIYQDIKTLTGIFENLGKSLQEAIRTLQKISSKYQCSNQYTNQMDNNNIIVHDQPKQGTSSQYALRRLRKSRPDLPQRVLNGEMSAHKAMIQALPKKIRFG